MWRLNAVRSIREIAVRASVGLALISLLAWPAVAKAWNVAGHMVIAAIGYTQLGPQQRQSLVKLLRAHPRFEQDFASAMPKELSDEQQSRWIFLRAATWPDLARSFMGEDLVTYNHPTWHYIDLPIYLNKEAVERIHPPPMEFTVPMGAAARQSMNVVQALESAAADWTDVKLPPPQRAVALCWILHLAADIHQPLLGATLYSAQRFRIVPIGDKGGNDIPIRDVPGVIATTSTGRKPNLHALWDAMLGAEEDDDAAFRTADRIILACPQRGVQELVKQSDVASWAQESCEIAAVSVYTPSIRGVVEASEAHPHAPLNPIEIDDAYLSTGRRIAQERAALAGYRLAQLLISSR